MKLDYQPVKPRGHGAFRTCAIISVVCGIIVCATYPLWVGPVHLKPGPQTMHEGFGPAFWFGLDLVLAVLGIILGILATFTHSSPVTKRIGYTGLILCMLPVFATFLRKASST